MRVCFTASSNGALEAWELADEPGSAAPRRVAELKLGGDIFSSPLVCGGMVVVGCRDEYLYGVELIT